MLTHLHIVSDYFHATRAELSIFRKDHILIMFIVPQIAMMLLNITRQHFKMHIIIYCLIYFYYQCILIISKWGSKCGLCAIGRISQKCPCPNFQNLYATSYGKRELIDVINLKSLSWRDYYDYLGVPSEIMRVLIWMMKESQT